MTVLFKVDWDSGSYASNVYTFATPEVPNGHTLYNFPTDALFSESAAPWNGQWLASLGLFLYTRADTDLTSATVHATSGRVLFQMVPPTTNPNGIFDLKFAATPGNGRVMCQRNGSGNLTFDFAHSGGGGSNFYDYGACPSVPVNVEIIYDAGNATALDRMRVRVWAVGTAPGNFVSSGSAGGSAGTTAQFDLLHLSDGNNNASGIRFGLILLSDDIAEDLSALLPSPGVPAVRKLWRRNPRNLAGGLFGALARVDRSSAFPILARQQLFDERTLSTSVTEAADALASTASTTGGGVVATLSVTEANDALSATAANAIVATLSATEAADALAASTTSAIVATLTATEAADALASTATNAIVATLSATEAADALASTVSTGGGVVATLSITEANDAISSTATNAIAAILSATEAADALASTATNAIVATLAAVEAGDTLSATAGTAIAATLSVTEAGDGFTSAAGVQVAAVLSVTEAGDALASTASIPPFLVTATLAIVEESDYLVAFTGITAGDPFFTVTGKRGRYAIAADGRGFVVTTDREFDAAAPGRHFAASGGRRFTA